MLNVKREMHDLGEKFTDVLHKELILRKLQFYPVSIPQIDPKSFTDTRVMFGIFVIPLPVSLCSMYSNAFF
jgi:hypothetical protein